MQALDHGLEVVHLATPGRGRAVAAVRGQEPDAVVTPVVPEALLEQMVVVDELMHGQQFDRRDAELPEVVGHRRMGHAGVGAADRLGDIGMTLGEALDVRLVDDGLVQGNAEAAVALPIERSPGHHALGHGDRPSRGR